MKLEGWRVDFNMGLAAFEDDVKGVRNLIDLALSSSLVSPPHFLFPSSVAVVHSAYFCAAPFGHIRLTIDSRRLPWAWASA